MPNNYAVSNFYSSCCHLDLFVTWLHQRVNCKVTLISYFCGDESMALSFYASCGDERQVFFCGGERLVSCGEERLVLSFVQLLVYVLVPSCGELRMVTSCGEERMVTSCGEEQLASSCGEEQLVPSYGDESQVPSCDEWLVSCGEERLMPSFVQLLVQLLVLMSDCRDSLPGLGY